MCCVCNLVLKKEDSKSCKEKWKSGILRLWEFSKIGLEIKGEMEEKHREKRIKGEMEELDSLFCLELSFFCLSLFLDQM